MPIELRILTGARGGHSESFEQRTITLGRHADADLRFDPNTDLDVSVWHAEIVARRGSGYRLRDSGSTNGTFLNGRRISGSETLHDGDTIWLGAEGPQVEVHLSGSAVRDAGAKDLSSIGINTPSLGARRAPVGMVRLIASAVVLFLIGVGVVYWFTRQR
jgi:pSer/pThr/pTyr-binding forkhead associated (FHA) protein